MWDIGIPAYLIFNKCIQFICHIYMMEELRISYCFHLSTRQHMEELEQIIVWILLSMY